MTTTHAACPSHSGQWYDKSTGACSCGSSHSALDAVAHWVRYNEYGGITESIPDNVFRAQLADLAPGWTAEFIGEGRVWASINGQGREYVRI